MDLSQFSDEAFAAYLAGFTDGEGNIDYERPDKTPRNNNKNYVRITLANCVESVLIGIQQRLGYGVIRSQKQRENWRRRYVFIAQNQRDCEKFLLMVRPYLQIKGEDADTALERIATTKQRRQEKCERNDAMWTMARAGASRKQIAAHFKVSPSMVSRICAGHHWNQRSESAKKRKRNDAGYFLPSD